MLSTEPVLCKGLSTEDNAYLDRGIAVNDMADGADTADDWLGRQPRLHVW